MSEIRSQATPARDQELELKRDLLDGDLLGNVIASDAARMARNAIQRGWSKPRTVNSATELDALPVGSVVRVNDANDVISHVCLRYSDGWFTTLHESMVYPLAVTGSVTVLFTPGEAG
ncbi:hypothetical protein ACIGKR_12235 [Rhodococcus qingshengii]|uniref:hypothetical protein n=1 Tax=Rhodococcus qingshengii TaxID=334542 RepID=UPI0037C74C99